MFLLCVSLWLRPQGTFSHIMSFHPRCTKLVTWETGTKTWKATYSKLPILFQLNLPDN